MTPTDLLAELARLAVVVEASGDHQILLDGALTDELIAASRVHRWLFTWGLRGAHSGHFWFVCDACSELQLLSRERACGMKPGCKGRMHRSSAPAFRPSEVTGSELEPSMEDENLDVRVAGFDADDARLDEAPQDPRGVERFSSITGDELEQLLGDAEEPEDEGSDSAGRLSLEHRAVSLVVDAFPGVTEER